MSLPRSSQHKFPRILHLKPEASNSGLSDLSTTKMEKPWRRLTAAKAQRLSPGTLSLYRALTYTEMVCRPIADNDNTQRWHIMDPGEGKKSFVNNGTGKLLTAVGNLATPVESLAAQQSAKLTVDG